MAKIYSNIAQQRKIKQRNIKIAVVSPRFAVSGVPLAQVRLARALVDEGFDVDLLFGNIDPEKARHIHAPGVNLIDLRCERVRSMFGAIRRYIISSKPNFIFSAEDHLNNLVVFCALSCLSSVVISGSSRVTPFDTYLRNGALKNWMMWLSSRAAMLRANALTCVSIDMVDQYRQLFSNAPHVAVYNIVDDGHARLQMREHVEHEWLVQKTAPVVVAAGSLAHWKGFVDLIDAFGILSQNRDVRLIILGEGPLRCELEKTIRDRELSNRVCMPGNVPNPLKYFAKADVFALSSHVEGLPNVLVEAMMCGCTPVATNCPTGPREVLADGRFGYLVPVHDSEALAAGIEMALDKPVPHSMLAKAIRPFEAREVVSRHFAVLGYSELLETQRRENVKVSS